MTEAVIDLPVEFEKDLTMPEVAGQDPAMVWNSFLEEHRPHPALIRRWVLLLNNKNDHPQIIALLQSALLRGQSQPWMYEVLALSMEIEGRPKEEIERVVFSLNDFGGADFASMLVSGAYLTRMGRKAAALRLYQQASKMLPEREEPFVLGLKLARDAGTAEDVQWAASGILLNSWGAKSSEYHASAEDALLDRIRALQRKGDLDGAAKLQESLVQARSRDVIVRLEWSGDADLDMSVEEPTGSICSFEEPVTQGGGQHLHDGIGPSRKDSYELYVCPRGMSGTYRVIVKSAFGRVVGNRATLTITKHAGLSTQTEERHSVNLESGEASVTFVLEDGRRTAPKVVIANSPAPAAPILISARDRRPRISNRHDPRAARAAEDFAESRRELAGQGVRPAGAVGVAPVVSIIPSGTTMSAQGVISADRRYVRIGIQPTFSEVTDVFTFSFINGGSNAATAPR